ncbi:MAG TPA: rhodanese-like domain-containing protein [Acetobacteraceae bacterium]|nr:rhodanese-like domain-containing protein [Acetobacteraceae bacterium]
MVENVSPGAAWQALTEDPDAVLCDVRTEPEWAFVGMPDLNPAGKEPVLIPWQVYPTMQVNPSFLDALRQAGVRPDQRVFFICRSGGRSMAAARAAEAAGYAHAFNVAGGFEGPTDPAGHRGTEAGWKAEGLPWRQS